MKIGDIDGSADALGASNAISRSRTDDTLYLALGSIYAEGSEMIRIPVSASNFNSMAAIEGSVRWDGATLRFMGVDGYNMEGLSDDNFALPENSENTLTFNWINAAIGGTTLEEGHVLFYLNFESLGSIGEQAVVEFLDEPLELFAVNSNLQEVEVEPIHSDVAIVEPILINTTIVNNDCFGSSQGRISLSITGGTGNFNYEWDNGTFGPLLEDLDAGIYNCTVTDVFSGKTESVQAEINSPSELTISFETDSINYASVIVQGGTLPYSYEWSNGSTTSEINDLEPGSYSVAIVDANGCIIRGEVNIIAEILVSTDDEVLDQLELSEMNISPNPAKQFFIVELAQPVAEKTDIHMYDTNGKLIRSAIIPLGQSSVRITTDDLPDGLYYIHAITEQTESGVLILAR